MIDVLVGLVALLLIFFIPGFFLVLILFPKKGQLSRDFDLLFKSALAIALSILIAVLVAIVLDQIGAATGTPGINSVSLWVSMTVVSIALGFISWFFGGLRELTDSVLHRPSGTKESKDEEIGRLASEKKLLQQKLALLESDAYKSNATLRNEAMVRIPAVKKQIMDINRKIDEIVSQKETNT